MIRVISIVALSVLLIVVLYLPAAQPPDRFLLQIRREHEINSAFWGEARADRILQNMLAMSGALNDASPLPTPAQAPQTDRMATAVAGEMERVNQRFFNNAYFRSIDTLLMLAAYRLAALGEWLPLQGFAIAAILLDGYLVRILRAKEFKPHDPEWFALHAAAIVSLTCGCVVAFVVPFTILPAALGCLPVLVAFFASRVVANFHHEG